MVIPAKIAPAAIDNRPLLATADEVIKLPFGVPFRVIGNHRSCRQRGRPQLQKVSNGANCHIYVLRRDGLRVPHAASDDDKSRKNFQSFLKSLYAREYLFDGS